MPYIEETEYSEEELHGYKVTTVHIRTEQEAEQFQKAIGDYITIETGRSLNQLEQIEDIGECLAEVLNRIMQPYYHGKLCIVGIGNKDLPADALGPETVHNLPLRILSEIGAVENFREVCSLVPGTALTNNIDTEVIVKGVVHAIGADCVLLVDSLNAKETSRLFQTIQISTAGGLSPRLSGRKADWDALNIPVISLGVPVTIPLSALVPHQERSQSLFTSTEVASVIASAARIIAYALLRMCWPSKSKAECFLLSGLNRDPVPFNFSMERETEKPEPA